MTQAQKIDPSTPIANLIDLSAIVVNDAANCRSEKDATALAELATSMKKEGLLQPVRLERREDGKFNLVFGFRRLAAAQQLGWTQIRAEICDPMTAEDKAIANLLENIGRESLSTYDMAMAFAKIQADHGLSGSAIGGRVGKTTAYVNALIRIANGLHETVLARWRQECSSNWGKDENGKRASNVHTVCTTDWLSKLVSRVAKHEQADELDHHLRLLNGETDEGGESNDAGDGPEIEAGEPDAGGPRIPQATKKIGMKQMEEALSSAETILKESTSLTDLERHGLKGIVAALKYTAGRSASLRFPKFKLIADLDTAESAKAKKSDTEGAKAKKAS